MPRPKSFVPTDAVRAARDHFWRYGYEATTLRDLEAVTRLNRSSLYQAFGTKRHLFDLALDSYLAEVAWPRLAPVEEPGAGPANVAGYFSSLAAALTAAPPEIAVRGCLIVNTITELGAHDADARAVGTAYRDRIRRAFAAAFATAMPVDAAARRAEATTAVLIGLLVTARVDVSAAIAIAGTAATEPG